MAAVWRSPRISPASSSIPPTFFLYSRENAALITVPAVRSASRRSISLTASIFLISHSAFLRQARFIRRKPSTVSCNPIPQYKRHSNKEFIEDDGNSLGFYILAKSKLIYYHNFIILFRHDLTSVKDDFLLAILQRLYHKSSACEGYFVLQQMRKAPHYKGEAQSQHCFFKLQSPSRRSASRRSAPCCTGQFFA